MSEALTDFLIDLADPRKLEGFKEDPEGQMTAANLTEDDKAALRSKKSGWVHYQAKRDASTVPGSSTFGNVPIQTEPTAIFNAQCAVLIIIIEIVPEISATGNSITRGFRRVRPTRDTGDTGRRGAVARQPKGNGGFKAVRTSTRK